VVFVASLSSCYAERLQELKIESAGISFLVFIHNTITTPIAFAFFTLFSCKQCANKRNDISTVVFASRNVLEQKLLELLP